MANFPSLIPSEAPITPGAWPSTAHASLNGAESRIRHGSAEIGRRWRPSFVNITEADFLAILNHYRGQRSGFDSFVFSTTTLAADLTPAGFAWVHTSRPQVVDQHVDCFTVQCEFKCEPRALAIAAGKTWRSVTTLTVNANPGVQWLTSETTFLPGKGVRVADGVQWITAATTLVQEGIVKGKEWVTSSTTLTKGLTSNGESSYTVNGGTSMAWASGTVAYGWTFMLSTSKIVKGAGFYDVGENGLVGSYRITIYTRGEDGQVESQLSFDTAENVPEIEIPSGTTATLSGPWRRVDLASGVTGATLAAGEYIIIAIRVNSSNVDSILKAASNLTIATGAGFGQNTKSTDGFTLTHTSGDDIGYFGPMIFFE